MRPIIGSFLSIVLVSVIGVSITSSTIPASAHAVAESGAERIFFSDDPDPLASDASAIGGVDLGWLTSSDRSPDDLARTHDFYFYSTRPVVFVGSDRVTSAGIQRHRLSHVSRSESTSRWFDSSETPTDGTYVKDAAVSIVDVTDGATLRAPGTVGDGQYLIPADGTVLSYTDFRIERGSLPERRCDPAVWTYEDEPIPEESRDDSDGTDELREETRRMRIDGDRWCYRYRLGDHYVSRRLRIGSQAFTSALDADGGPATLAYWNAHPTDVTELQVTAEIGIAEIETITHWNWDRDDGWRVEDIYDSERWYTHTVTDTRDVLITTNQDLTVRQRVIDTADTRAVIVLEFDAPGSLDDRRLWSRVRFGDQRELVNVWSVYSVGRAREGRMTSNRNPTPRSYRFPSLPELYVTARVDTPSVRIVSHGTLGYFVVPEVLDTERQRLGRGRFEPQSRVNLSTSPVYRYDTIVVKNAPGPVTQMLDIHGDPVPIQTTTHPYRRSQLSIDPIDGGGRVRIHLTTTGDHRGLDDRVVHLSGAARSTVRTNAQGIATVRPTTRYVTAEFRGDDWRDERSTYYGPAHETQRVRSEATLVRAVIAIADAWTVVGFWIVLAVLGWLWYTSR